MSIKVKKVQLNATNVLSGLKSPAIVSFTYHNGKYSAQPGTTSRRLVLVEDVTANSIAGPDFSRNGDYRKFSRRLIDNAVVHGVLIPAEVVEG